MSADTKICIDERRYWEFMDEITNLAFKDNAIDVGAKIGEYTGYLLDRGFTVHAFEPYPKNFLDLEFKYCERRDCFVNKLALSDMAGVMNDAILYQCWTLAPKDSSIDLDISIEHPAEEPFSVVFQTLDNYWNFDSWGTIDIMKIDVDGYEYKVIKGAQRVIHEYAPIIMLELSFMIKSIGDDPLEMLDFLEDQGYKFWSMDGINRSKDFVKKEFPWTTSCDIVCIP